MKLYQHYKGGLYIVLDQETINATNASNAPALGDFAEEQTLVTYYCIKNRKYFVRELKEFHEFLDLGDRKVLRFRYISDALEVCTGRISCRD